MQRSGIRVVFSEHFTPIWHSDSPDYVSLHPGYMKNPNLQAFVARMQRSGIRDPSLAFVARMKRSAIRDSGITHRSTRQVNLDRLPNPQSTTPISQTDGMMNTASRLLV